MELHDFVKVKETGKKGYVVGFVSGLIKVRFLFSGEKLFHAWQLEKVKVISY